MDGRNLPRELIEAHMVYRYVGPGYLMGVPARDLTAADLLEVREREGVSRAEIEATGIYEPMNLIEIEPFCGVEGCREPVGEWGEHCGAHRGALEAPLTEIRGIGLETAADLAQRGLWDIKDLAGLRDEELEEIADSIPRVSVGMMESWRRQAQELDEENRRMSE